MKVIFFKATMGSKNYTICKMHVRNIFQTDWGQLISLYTMSNNGFFAVSFILQWTVYFNAWLSCRETLLDQIFVYNFHSIYCSVFPISLIVTITFSSCLMIASQETWNWVAINVQDLIWFHHSTCMQQPYICVKYNKNLLCWQGSCATRCKFLGALPKF